VRVATIFGPGRAAKDLKPFQAILEATWLTGLPADPNQADAIFVFGGDGTVHRHLAELVRLALPVLVVPCGSGNDFARALGLRTVSDSLAAWHNFSKSDGNAWTIDLGTIMPLPSKDAGEGARATQLASPQYFCCVGGVGLDGEIARRANQLPRWLRAHGGYAFTLLPALARFAPVPMRISGGGDGHSEVARETRPVVVTAFANAPAYGGGMKIAPQARLDDGVLDICVIRDMNKLKLLCLFPTIYFGRHLGIRQVEYFQTDCLRVETEEPLDVYADGDYVCRTPIEVRVARGALRVIRGRV
jgi:diacylglycerol kinase (ATP)